MKQSLDIWLDRGIKFVGIIGFFGAAAMAVNRMLFLPGKVTALEAAQSMTDSKIQTYDVRFAKVEKDVEYIKEKVTFLVTKVER